MRGAGGRAARDMRAQQLPALAACGAAGTGARGARTRALERRPQVHLPCARVGVARLQLLIARRRHGCAAAARGAALRAGGEGAPSAAGAGAYARAVWAPCALRRCRLRPRMAADQPCGQADALGGPGAPAPARGARQITGLRPLAPPLAPGNAYGARQRSRAQYRAQRMGRRPQARRVSGGAAHLISVGAADQKPTHRRQAPPPSCNTLPLPAKLAATL